MSNRKVTHDIVLESSSRVTHQLSTAIFKIFLEEVLNYKRVVIREMPNIIDNNTASIGRLTVDSETETGDEEDPTPIMINVEVWTPPQFDQSYFVDECGKIANPGRIGWFIPANLSIALHSLRKTVAQLDNPNAIVHWQLFEQEDFVRIFDITDERHLSLIREKSRDVNGQYFCPSSHCIDGTYIPANCLTKRCATLLAPDFTSSNFSIEDINKLKLLVKVVWLGPNLAEVSRTLQAEYLQNSAKLKSNSLLILSWTPSEVIPRANDYLTVTFPTCEISGDHSKLGCKYELSRLLKFAWIGLKQHAKLAYDALKAFKFSDEEYIDLLDRYNNSTTKSIPDIACTWFHQNADIWKAWKGPLNWKDKGVVWIGGIFPLYGDLYTGQDILKGATSARDAINNSTILEDFELKLQIHDGQCRADRVMKAYITYVTTTGMDVDSSPDALTYKNMIGILGPACSDTVEPLIGISKHFETIVISYSAEGSGLSDRTKYPYFFRTIGDNKQYKHVYRSLFSKLGWHRFGALTEDGQKYTEYISQMTGYLEEEGISLIENVKFPREKNTFEMTRYLQDLNQKRARIIIADIFDDVARTVMCEAYKLNMIAKNGYVWFLPSWLNATWYDTAYFNLHRNETVNCTTANMIEAVNGYFSITHANYAADSDRMQENITVREWRDRFNSLKKNNHHDHQSSYAGYAYDAVWTYAYALDKLIKNDSTAMSTLHSHSTTEQLVQLVQDSDFHGVSGHIKFYGGASRFSDIHVVQWYNNESRVVGTFTPNISGNNPEQHGGDLILNESRIVWLSPSGKPSDGTQPPQVCALEWLANFLKTECEDTIIILNVVLGVVVLLLASFGVYVVHKQYHRKMADSRKLLEHFGINFDMRDLNVMDLDKWEIAREKIVINRKLGEGAFGAVYGGELDMAEKGWVMVAVKTLKEGSTAEEKLDFLSEAEVMKRFDHNNIVKLLGVCMKTEPTYTVMEFMLFGDLKTFLLARRNLVNEKNSEETEEISPKKLTNMALDVARALGYLAELKFVHRDIASRNCLISNTRSVKLGDFGMTRLMYENDYYRFNRKGMLPVRWMAPESLALGVFTPQSDVWSYGVLLYEIVTFGSFPFQGMTNNQVLEHVKEGNNLKIPSGVKVQLEGLMKLCWNQDYKKRPNASEIVEYLANNPRLITPCLEGPTASVQIENTGQMEMQLPESQFRKCSSTLSTKHVQNLANGSIPQASRSYESSPAKQQQASTANSPPHRVHSSSPLNSLDPTSSHNYGIMLNERKSPADIDYCPREPLLGATNSSRSNSLLALAKFVTGGGGSNRDPLSAGSSSLGAAGGIMLVETNRIPDQRCIDMGGRVHDDSGDSDSDAQDDYMNIVPNGQVVTHA